MNQSVVALACVATIILSGAAVGFVSYEAGRQAGYNAWQPTPIHQSNAGLMVASWYGPGFAGKQTASGTYFDPSDMTCASRSLPMGTRLLVGLGGKWVQVTVTDRGPVNLDRDLDLSESAAKHLGFTKRGLAAVHVIQLEDNP